MIVVVPGPYFSNSADFISSSGVKWIMADGSILLDLLSASRCFWSGAPEHLMSLVFCGSCPESPQTPWCNVPHVASSPSTLQGWVYLRTVRDQSVKWNPWLVLSALVPEVQNMFSSWPVKCCVCKLGPYDRMNHCWVRKWHILLPYCWTPSQILCFEYGCCDITTGVWPLNIVSSSQREELLFTLNVVLHILYRS